MTILVTGIGGVVGQGILRNLRDIKRDLIIIGTNTVKVSAGNFLCDSVIEVPFASDARYIPAMQKIVNDSKVDLIIPSTDYETFYLGLNQQHISCTIACSPPEVAKFCLDKYENYLAFRKYNLPFAESILPSAYKNQFRKCIVKPREGRGSRNIHINPPDPSLFDDTFVVQDLLDGPEITTSFYITKNGEFHGMITFVRELEHGNTTKCETVFDFDTELSKLVKKIIQHHQFRGSCNIQSKVTAEGIIPFELNCRISGTNSIRPQFGFNDVLYTIEEYLFKTPPTPPDVRQGAAMRIMLDLIYPNASLKDISNKNDHFYIH